MASHYQIIINREEKSTGTKKTLVVRFTFTQTFIAIKEVAPVL